MADHGIMPHGPNNKLKEARRWLLYMVVASVGLRVVIWAITPLVPYAIGIAIAISFIALVVNRTTKF